MELVHTSMKVLNVLKIAMKTARYAKMLTYSEIYNVIIRLKSILK